MSLNCYRVDYRNPHHAEALVELLDSYATDPMGGGTPLQQQVREQLCAALAARADAISFIVEVDGKNAGLINCFEGFSTFKCKPLLNIHDLAVKPEFRGRGIAVALINAAEEYARSRHCCKLTLEVLEGNQVARQLYAKVGFNAYQLDPKQGNALFFEKSLA